MKCIVIRKNDIDFLLSNFSNPKLKREFFRLVEEQDQLAGNRKSLVYEFSLTEVVIEYILDELSDLLILKGFDSNDDLNSMGSYIEGLIDQFSSIYYD